LIFRVTKLPERDTYRGWIWLIGYTLDDKGEAVERREIWVRIAGLRLLSRRPATNAPAPGRPMNPTATPTNRRTVAPDARQARGARV